MASHDGLSPREAQVISREIKLVQRRTKQLLARTRQVVVESRALRDQLQKERAYSSKLYALLSKHEEPPKS